MKTPVYFNLWYSSTWNDITSDVLATEEHQPTISGGQQNWLSRVSPTKLDLSIINTTIRAGDDPSKIGKYSPRNAESPLYGLLGRNTPLRVYVRWLADDFGRTVASGWGTSGSHLDSAGKETAIVGSLAWTVTGSGSGSSAVGSAVGTLTQTTADGFRLAFLGSGANIRDAEVRVVVTADEANIDGGEVQFGNVVLRLIDANNYYYARVAVSTAEVVTVGIRKVVSGVNSEVAAPVTVTGLTYSGQQFAVAFLADGPHLAAKVWAAASGEPFAWQVTATDTSLTAAGAPGVRPTVALGNTDVPIIFTYDNFEVRNYRFTGEVEAWPQEWTLNAYDDGNGVVWAPLTAYGLMYRLGLPGQDVLARSALRRWYSQQTSPAPIAYWPMEDESDATQAASGLVGGTALTFSGTLRPGDSSVPGGVSSGIRSSGSTAGSGVNRFSGMVGNGAFTYSGTQLVVDYTVCAETFSGAPAAATGQHLDVALSQASPVGQVYLSIKTYGTPGFIVSIFQGGGSANTTINDADASTALNGAPHHVRWILANSGANCSVTIQLDGSTVATGTVTGKNLPALNIIGVPEQSQWDNSTPAVVADMPVTFSHVAIWNTSSAPSPATAAFGHVGETADDRVSRVCDEEGIEAFVHPDAGVAMGPQPVAPPLQMFVGSGEVAEQGVFGEPRHTSGFTFRANESISDQDPTVTLDYAAEEVAPPMLHREDLDHAQNDIIVTRRGGGSSGQVLKETGQLNASDPHTDPKAIGPYPVRPVLSLETDAQAATQAGRRLRHGTTDELRFAAVGVDLTALYRADKTALLGDVLAVDPGDKILIENLPSWLGGGDTAQLQRGFTEVLGPFHWTIEHVTGPARPHDTSGLLLPDVSGDYASTPDTANLDVGSDIEIRCDATLTDWTSGNQHLVAKFNTSGNQRSYRLFVDNTGALVFSWSADGTSSNSLTSSTTIPIADGERIAVRVFFDANNGAAGRTATFYTGPGIDGPWTQLGTPVTSATATSLFNSTAALEVGSRDAGTAELAGGTIHAAQVYGSTGILRASPRFQEQAPGITSFVDDVGLTWTVNGNATIV